MNFILEKVENEFGVYESYKKLNLVDVITFSDLAWSYVSEKTILNCFNSLYENKNKDLIAKTDLEKIVQDFVKKTDIYDQLSPAEYINIRYNELDEVVNELEEEKFDENKNEIDEIEPIEKDKCVIEYEVLSAMDLL